MFKHSKLYQALLFAWAAGSSYPLLAQQQTSDSAAEEDVEVVAVTGTRIRSPNLTSPSPITSIDSQMVLYTGKTSVQEIVAELGSLVGSSTNSEVNNGENALNLRNLGAQRTLVLVDGQRFVGGFGGSAAVDTNIIPTVLIERVDVFTGGASAVYGADAVTGVVNFVLKDDFSGLAFDAQYGNAQEGDFSDSQFSITAGHNYDKGNITFSYTYGNRPIVDAKARAESSTNVHQLVTNLYGDKPAQILMAGTRESFFTEQGARIDPFGMFSTGFNGDGTPFKHGINVGSFAGTGEAGGDGIPNWLLFAQGIRPASKRHVFMLKADYDLSDQHSLYTSLNYSLTDTRMYEQHTLTVGSQLARDNAYMPAQVLAAADAAGWDDPIFFNRWDLDSGYQDLSTDKDTYRFILGVRGELTDNLSYDVALNLGKTKREQTVANNRFFDRYMAAMDAVLDANGEIVCRSDLDPASFNNLAGDLLATAFDASLGAVTFTPGANSGCVPFNPLTQDLSVNQAAVNWIWQPTTDRTELTQQVFTAYVEGSSDDWFELPGGPLGFVAGFEHRKEESAVVFDAISGSERTVASYNGSNLSGDFDVNEVFAEASLPVLDFLLVDMAYRFSDYSTIGNTDAWKLGVQGNTPIGLTLRATLSSAVRAPNIGELFQPRRNISISLPRDPCHKDNLGNGTEFRAQNCATELSALGVDPATFSPLLGTFFPAIRGGNPDLKEETANTQTMGVFWQSDIMSGVSLSLDYFSIDMEDAVISPGVNDVFDACYDSASLDNVFCTLIGRDKTTGAANFAEIEAVNVAKIETAGYEFAATIGLPESGIGNFRLNLNASYLDKLAIQKTALPELVDDKGLFNTDSGGSSPKWVLNLDVNWRMDNWDANYSFGYSSKTLRSPLINAQRKIAHELIGQPYVKAYRNHDLQVGYRPDEQDMRVYVGIRNLTDEYPDSVSGSLNGPSGRQGFAGRVWYAGINWRFDQLFD